MQPTSAILNKLICIKHTNSISRVFSVDYKPDLSIREHLMFSCEQEEKISYEKFEYNIIY